MTIKYSIKKHNLIETALILLLLLLVFGLLNPMAASAQVDENSPVVDQDELVQQISETSQLDDNGVMSKARALRKLVFSFLASTTGLSSLFWLVVRGGWTL